MSEGLIDGESCPREGEVGATRQGQHRLWSGKELLQIITSHGRARAAPTRDEYGMFHHPPFIIYTWPNSTPKNITDDPSA